MPNHNAVKVFVCAHPDSVLIYKNMARLVQTYDPKSSCILWKINHPYFAEFDFTPYRGYFDEVWEFDYIHYEKNVLRGLLGAFRFQRQAQRAIADFLRRFGSVDFFVFHSTWLPTNVLLSTLRKEKGIRKIVRFILWETEQPQAKVDLLKSLFCNFYAFLLRCSRVRVMKTFGGKFAGFVYRGIPAGTLVRIVSPVQKDGAAGRAKVFPYPVVREHETDRSQKKDMVIILGDEGALREYAEYLPDSQAVKEKLSALFEAIADHYAGCELYYKPHPGERRLMPGIDVRYRTFNNSMNAEALFDRYAERIKAVYSLSSNSVVIGSFFGIPSYAFYPYLCNQAGVKKFDRLFHQEHIRSKFLLLLSDIREVGTIDNLEQSKVSSGDKEDVFDYYRAVLDAPKL